MPPNSHAILSASSSHRWMNCTPSARLEREFADRETEAAAEGTAAHALCEHKLRRALKMRSRKPVSKYDCDEMDGYTDGYVEFVLEQLTQAKLEWLEQNAQNAARAAETPAPKQEYPRSIKDRLQHNKAAINAPKQGSVQRMVDREAKRAEGKGIGYDRWAAVHNLKQMAATMSIYEESGFSSPEELEAALAAASAELSSVHAELKAVESTLHEKKDLQKQLLAYIKTKPARDGLKAQKTEKARRNYREQHESDFMIAEAATRYFKAQGIQKLPASKTLQAEIEQLMREKNSLYNEYREKREKTKELQTVKNNIGQILRREPERGKGRDNER